MKEKLPDNIVFNYETEKFDASQRSYPTSVGSVNFEPLVVDKSSSATANHYFNSKLNELKEEYKKLVEEYNWTKLVYEAEYSFQPIVGHIYHLYEKKDKNLWLSLISPQEWGSVKQEKAYVASFKLDTIGKWQKCKDFM